LTRIIGCVVNEIQWNPKNFRWQNIEEQCLVPFQLECFHWVWRIFFSGKCGFKIWSSQSNFCWTLDMLNGKSCLQMQSSVVQVSRNMLELKLRLKWKEEFFDFFNPSWCSDRQNKNKMRETLSRPQIWIGMTQAHWIQIQSES
jgi:hypothetical protein